MDIKSELLQQIFEYISVNSQGFCNYLSFSMLLKMLIKNELSVTQEALHRLKDIVIQIVVKLQSNQKEQM